MVRKENYLSNLRTNREKISGRREEYGMSTIINFNFREVVNIF
jgi:hypothetical protein